MTEGNRLNYDDLAEEAKALIEGVLYPISNLANLSALIYQNLENINWAGFYLAEGGCLMLGPFQGKPACIKIPFGKGVCGTAAAEDRTVLVPDVHEFSGHIACDSASRSEIVIPVHRGSQLMGVLDIDSPVTGRFSEEDQKGLEKIVKVLEKNLLESGGADCL